MYFAAQIIETWLRAWLRVIHDRISMILMADITPRKWSCILRFQNTETMCREDELWFTCMLEFT